MRTELLPVLIVFAFVIVLYIITQQIDSREDDNNDSPAISPKGEKDKGE